MSGETVWVVPERTTVRHIETVCELLQHGALEAVRIIPVPEGGAVQLPWGGVVSSDALGTGFLLNVPGWDALERSAEPTGG